MTTLKIHSIDDDVEMREALSFLLAQNGYSVQRHATADAFLASPHGVPEAGVPMLVLTDYRMPGCNGLSLLRSLRERAALAGAPLAVILLSGHATVPLAVEAMREGAVHVLEKPVDPDVLLDTVAAALRDLKSAIPAEKDLAARARLDTLTPREREVLASFVARGSNKAVANALSMSPRTVEVHRTRIFRKSGASCVTELVRMAIAAGIVEDSARNGADGSLGA